MSEPAGGRSRGQQTPEDDWGLSPDFSPPPARWGTPRANLPYSGLGGHLRQDGWGHLPRVIDAPGLESPRDHRFVGGRTDCAARVALTGMHVVLTDAPLSPERACPECLRLHTYRPREERPWRQNSRRRVEKAPGTPAAPGAPDVVAPDPVAPPTVQTAPSASPARRKQAAPPLSPEILDTIAAIQHGFAEEKRQRQLERDETHRQKAERSLERQQEERRQRQLKRQQRNDADRAAMLRGLEQRRREEVFHLTEVRQPTLVSAAVSAPVPLTPRQQAREDALQAKDGAAPLLGTLLRLSYAGLPARQRHGLISAQQAAEHTGLSADELRWSPVLPVFMDTDSGLLYYREHDVSAFMAENPAHA